MGSTRCVPCRNPSAVLPKFNTRKSIPPREAHIMPAGAADHQDLAWSEFHVFFKLLSPRFDFGDMLKIELNSHHSDSVLWKG